VVSLLEVLPRFSNFAGEIMWGEGTSSVIPWDDLPGEVRTDIILNLVANVDALNDRLTELEDKEVSRSSREYDDWQMSMGEDL
jgi:hypothetical protein